VLAALLELAPSGVEQVDHPSRVAGGEGFVEYALYGAPGELPAFPEGEAVVGGVLVTVRGEEVAEDWAERWKQFHEPVLVGERIWVRPPWAARREGALDLVIDPGQAFGTGAHPTTKLSLELMLDLEPGGSFADLGCGSGVLAIAAAMLGFAPITAVDNEPAALAATRANAIVNGVSLDTVERVNLREQAPPRARTVAANLVGPLLLQLAGSIEAEALILSGLLEGEADEVATAFGRREERRLAEGGWAALLLL
jgi:ribosomal protein L11 methyltransferase